MPNTKPFIKSTGIKVSVDNPFKDDVQKFIARMKQTNRIIESDDVTVTIKRNYFKGAYAKIYQNSELLDDLSPEACKVLIHIALNMDYEEQVIHLRHTDLNMDRRRTSRGILELLSKRILCKQKREWYWVNITLLIVGNIDKENNPIHT